MLSKGTLPFIALLFLCRIGHAQLPDLDSVSSLLNDISVQIEITEGVDNMYNFQFEKAESRFRWLKSNYPRHPLPYFLFGLSNWWKMMPNIEGSEKYDEVFISYMDSSIVFAEELLEKNEESIDAGFFLAAAHSFKGRLYSERESWTRAAISGKKALNYLENWRDKDLGVEFLFGDGLYNYYSVWIRENYKALRPIMWFFPKGDKEKGIEQLKKVSQESFYARIEAMMWLIKIYRGEDQKKQALLLSEYLNSQYPDNPYFHRYYARMLYETGKYTEMSEVSSEILKRIESKKVGYEEISGRYASFYLGSYYTTINKNTELAKENFLKTVDFSEKSSMTKSGYCLYALSYLAGLYEEEKNLEETYYYYKKILDYADKKHSTYKEAKTFIKKNKSELKKAGIDI